MIIRELREKKGITQTKLAEILGVGRTTITMYEKGTIVPPADILRKLADYFNVSVDYLLGREETVKEEKPAIKMTDFIDKCIEFNITSEDLKKLSKDDWTLIVSIVNNLLKKY